MCLCHHQLLLASPPLSPGSVFFFSCCFFFFFFFFSTAPTTAPPPAVRHDVNPAADKLVTDKPKPIHWHLDRGDTVEQPRHQGASHRKHRSGKPGRVLSKRFIITSIDQSRRQVWVPLERLNHGNEMRRRSQISCERLQFHRLAPGGVAVHAKRIGQTGHAQNGFVGGQRCRPGGSVGSDKTMMATRAVMQAGGERHCRRWWHEQFRGWFVVGGGGIKLSSLAVSQLCKSSSLSVSKLKKSSSSS